ncbi:suppressor of SWI4 1 homolog [Sinocyclocheilus grahami]|uniref:suppressor of SWI4 1 homolog n=1 Tax=Sinocyclocheilus grahami TaxID=75366 RepID=UPI0007ACA95C|nr:PREDICTED: suppressor of SWI4 1 homolog [Sinocyclocheilus grahami]
MGKTKTKNQKKARVAASRVAEETYSTVPHTFVFHRGQIGKNGAQLVADMRRVMEPFTARALKVRKNNVLKDFVAVAGPLGITHFSIFTKTENTINMLQIGPRMTLQLVKISEGMGEGKVLYHSFISKTEEELQEMLKRKEARLKEKEERKRKQEQNIALKKDKRDQNKQKSMEGIKRKRQQEGQVSDDEVEDPGKPEGQAPAEESEDEAEYYRQAVGEEPDEDMFPGAKRKRGPGKSTNPFKKRKLSPGKGPPHDKKSFKSFDRGNKDGRKRFGDRKPLEGRNRFRKSEGGKKFGQKGGKGNRFAGQKKGDTGKKFGGQKTFKGRAVMKRQKGAGGKKDFKHKKGKS